MSNTPSLRWYDNPRRSLSSRRSDEVRFWEGYTVGQYKVTRDVEAVESVHRWRTRHPVLPSILFSFPQPA